MLDIKNQLFTQKAIWFELYVLKAMPMIIDFIYSKPKNITQKPHNRLHSDKCQIEWFLCLQTIGIRELPHLPKSLQKPCCGI